MLSITQAFVFGADFGSRLRPLLLSFPAKSPAKP
jgi:hypothetical protein